MPLLHVTITVSGEASARPRAHSARVFSCDTTLPLKRLYETLETLTTLLGGYAPPPNLLEATHVTAPIVTYDGPYSLLSKDTPHAK